MLVDAKGDPRRLHILASLLAYPEDDALDALRDLLPEATWLAAAIRELERLPLEDWQAEHTRLFLNGYPRTPCPPFESAYRHGQMGGAVVADIAALYRRAGLESREVPPDYLGTLLECVAWLEEEGDPACLLAELWEKHLLGWLPRYALDLQTHGGLELYRALGRQLAELCIRPDPSRSRGASVAQALDSPAPSPLVGEDRGEGSEGFRWTPRSGGGG